MSKAYAVVALLLASTAHGAGTTPDNPHYRDGVLTLPAVSTDAQVGKYQDATFELTSTGTWRLSGVSALGEGDNGFYRAPVTRVEAIKMGSAPTQVLLRVQGEFNGGCGSIGRITQRRVGTAFQVLVADAFKAYPVAICTAAMVPYVKTFPLDVYGLPAGSYTYEVNGVSGSFELSTENVYPGDCFGSSTCR